MGNGYQVNQIGVVRAEGGDFRLELDAQYRDCLLGLEGFSYLNILWWFSRCDDTASRGTRVEEKPYTKGPGRLGVFATRSPRRPNPIALSCARVAYLDLERGVVGLTYVDADDGTPLLDIKSYTPSLDRVAAPDVPGWCAHWPKDVEHSGGFPWEDEFNF